jgi:NTE family protein
MTRVGLVLGAGGVTGDAFHRGVLRALDESGWDARAADAIVGTSAGAMVGSHLRRPRAPKPGTGGSATVHGRRLGRVPDLSPFLAVLRRPWQARAGVLATSMLPTGQHSTEFIAAGVRHYFGDAWSEQPLYIAAVRRRDGRRVVFGAEGAPRTDLARAVAASCAIPGYFHPVEIDGESYVDGGVHSPTNADVLVGKQLDIVIVSSPMSLTGRPRATLDVGPRLWAARYLRREARALRAAGASVLTIAPEGELLRVMGLNPLHGGRIDEIEQAAYRHALAALKAAPAVASRLTGAGGRRTA